MNFLPFENFEITSQLQKGDVITELMRNIEPEKTFRFWNSSSSKEFEGTLRGNEFNIKRIINYRNSFLPDIKGKIEGNGNETRIYVQMKIQTLVIVFLSIWITGILLFSIFTLFISKMTPNNYISLAPFGMILFAYLLTLGGYSFEARKAKKLLCIITQGKIKEV